MRRGWANDRSFYRAVVAAVLSLACVLLYLHVQRRPLPVALQPAPPVAIGAPDDLPDAAPRSCAPLRESHGAGHLPFDTQACLANSARGATTSDTVHRWVDAAGITHYSDRPPAAQGVTAHTARAVQREQAVSVRIETVDAVLPPYITSRAIADAVGIGKVFDDVLGLRTDGGLALRVVLAGSDAAFRRHAPRGSVSSTGVYITRQRRIVVRTQRDDEDTLAILRHEIVHALVHEWVGNLPTALNEGLATYFEHFEGRGMGGAIDPARYRREMAHDRATGAARPALVALLGMPNPTFHSRDRSGNYTRSLALVSTIMGLPERRGAMAALLQAQRANACVPVDATAVLARHWHGGLDGLAQAWVAHQRGAVAGVHAY